MTRILLCSATTGYQLRAFNDAAEQLGVELLFATDRCHRLEDPWQDRAVPVRFREVDESVEAIAHLARDRPIDGVIAVGDRPVRLAARAAEALGLPWHSPDGAAASADKQRARERFAAAGLPSPWFISAPADADPRAVAVNPQVQFPCVLKPLGLSGSRGVIRADDGEQFVAAYRRIRALLWRPDIRAARNGLEGTILVEQFIEGREFAIEGVLTHGRATVFAIFDKPDPLDGPFFEETIYVTPSRLRQELQGKIGAHVVSAARALGLEHGPFHAECRVPEIAAGSAAPVFMLEVAGRPIGGLCSRVLRFEPRARAPLVSLEHALIEHAVGRSIEGYRREPAAAAVMMIPIPERGHLKHVGGEDDARRVPGIDEVRITAKMDQLLERLPEAGSYLGFIFGRGTVPEDAERSVREAHAKLRFTIARPIPVHSATEDRTEAPRVSPASVPR